jgi:hypothetical protein
VIRNEHRLLYVRYDRKCSSEYGSVIIGQERVIDVLCSDTQPLVGMSLLKGFRVSIDVVDGGAVRIEPRI